MRKILKSGKNIFKFGVILFFIVVLGFSDLTPGALNYFGAEKLTGN